MEPDYTAWRFWMDLVQLVGIIVVGVYSWLSNRRRVNNKRFDDLEEKVAGLTSPDTCSEHRRETRQMQSALGRLQKDVEYLPSRGEVNKLTESMSKLAGKIENLDGRLGGVNRAVDLINEHLLSGGSKR